jgi:hypothetical protein
MNVLRILGTLNSGLLVEKGSQNPFKKENVSSGRGKPRMPLPT